MDNRDLLKAGRLISLNPVFSKFKVVESCLDGKVLVKGTCKVSESISGAEERQG